MSISRTAPCTRCGADVEINEDIQPSRREIENGGCVITLHSVVCKDCIDEFGPDLNEDPGQTPHFEYDHSRYQMYRGRMIVRSPASRIMTWLIDHMP